MRWSEDLPPQRDFEHWPLNLIVERKCDCTLCVSSEPVSHGCSPLFVPFWCDLSLKVIINIQRHAHNAFRLHTKPKEASQALLLRIDCWCKRKRRESHSCVTMTPELTRVRQRSDFLQLHHHMNVWERSNRKTGRSRWSRGRPRTRWKDNIKVYRCEWGVSNGLNILRMETQCQVC
jgi:hypothetical protein